MLERPAPYTAPYTAPHALKHIALRAALPALAMAILLTTPAAGATPESWAKLDRESEAACLKAANLASAKASAPLRYSDRLGIEARVIDGSWPQAHMKGAQARMLCLYNRKTKRAEVQEMPLPPAPPAPVKDVWWRAEAIGGYAATGEAVTLMLGSDGKIGGRSGCNGYSANYSLDGGSIKIFAPMIGTRMACAPAAMEQESRYRAILEAATRAEVKEDGALEIAAADGQTVRFRRQ